LEQRRLVERVEVLAESDRGRQRELLEHEVIERMRGPAPQLSGNQ